MKIILIPDSFKGTLSSSEICGILTEKARAILDAETVSVPVADGGEGSVDCFLTALGGTKKIVRVSGPFLKKLDAYYGIIGDTAVIETASCASLPQAGENKNPLITTTYGVGEQILDAAKNGVKNIIVGLGGSCTNDFGLGAACACGIKAINARGNAFIPTGGTLKDVVKIDISGVPDCLKKVKITAMCDIDNPPYGDRGAAKVFAPQKGADEKTVKILDDGVKSICDIIKRDFGADLADLKGGGAAGAFGAGLKAFFGAELKMGIDVVLETVGFEKMLDTADLVITGEGKIDSQSLRGKVVIGVSRAAKCKGVPVIAIVGGAEGDMSEAYEQGVSAIFTVNRLPQDFSVSKNYAAINLARTAEDVFRLVKTLNKGV
ncbi:MAG: glycerate kinase [Clostridia bacterium]|nr:glycerate kinase [Clostridia bacterium]